MEGIIFEAGAYWKMQEQLIAMSREAPRTLKELRTIESHKKKPTFYWEEKASLKCNS